MVTRTTGGSAAAALLACVLVGIPASPVRAEASERVERWAVMLKDSVTDPAAIAKQQVGRLRAPVRHVYDVDVNGAALKGYVVEATAAQVRKIGRDSRVENVERDVKIRLDKIVRSEQESRRADASPEAEQPLGGLLPRSVPWAGDALSYCQQWGHCRVGAFSAVNRSVGHLHAPQFIVPAPASVGVAVLDSGIDPGHPDLRVEGAVNFSPSPTTNDVMGHGTAVAGVIQALNNGIGVEGAAPGTPVWNVKVINDNNVALLSDVAMGLIWVAQNARAKNIRVANMSLGGTSPWGPLQKALRVVSAAGVVPVAAAMNANTSERWYPAGYPEALAVAATDRNDQRASFSNFGADWVDLAAPGVSILTTFPTYPNGSGIQDYGSASGTSLAAPFVSAGVALCITSGDCRGGPRLIAARVQGDTQRIPGTGTEYRSGLLQIGPYWLGRGWGLGMLSNQF